MAYKESKKKAIKLFKKGWECADIAEHLGVHIRNVQRWIKDFKQSQNLQPSESVAHIRELLSEANNVEIAPQEPEVIASTEGLDNPVFFPSKTWVDLAQLLAQEHFNVHKKYRQALDAYLDNYLRNPESNSRTINTISQALNRHIQGEREATSLYLLDVSRAAQLLQSLGWIVTRPTNDNIDNSNDE